MEIALDNLLSTVSFGSKLAVLAFFVAFGATVGVMLVCKAWKWAPVNINITTNVNQEEGEE